MASVPASVELASQQLAQGLARVGLGSIDLVKAPWTEIEPGVARLLGGAFDPRRPDHQAVALGIAAVFGKRLVSEHGAFYAQNRESPDGVVLGFPDDIVMLSPFGAAVEALTRSKLSQLEDVAKEIRTALGRARLSTAAPQRRLTPQDYEHLFDPALVQLVLLDRARLKELWETPAGTVARNMRSALDRATQMPADLKKVVESQILAAFGALDPGKTLIDQMAQAGRMIELAPHLTATVEATRPAPEEFWAGVVFPLLFIGAPETLPPLDDEDRAAIDEGIDPMHVYLDVVPYQFQAPDGGVLGAFDENAVSLVHPAMGGLSPLRLLELKLDVLGPALRAFDPAKSRDAFHRFTKSISQQTGKALETRHAEPVFEAVSALIAELKKVWDAREKGPAAMRRLTEAEAVGEPALGLVRNALQGPRIILV